MRRAVGIEITDKQEERFFLLPHAEEIDRPIGDPECLVILLGIGQLGDVAAQRVVGIGLRAGHKPLLPRTPSLSAQVLRPPRQLARTLAGERPEMVEVEVRVGRREVQLAADGRLVAVVFQNGRQEELVLAGQHAIGQGPVDMGVAAGEEAVSRGGANRRAGVRRGEPGPLPGQAIQVGRLDDRVPRSSSRPNASRRP